MKMKYVFFYLLILILIINTSCITSNSSLNVFFHKVDNTLTKTEKQELINCESIDCVMSFTLTNSNTEFKELFKNYVPKINGIEYSQVALIFAYKKNKKNQNYHFDSINNEIKKYLKEQKIISELSIIKLKENEKNIAKINYDNYNKTDTLCLIFPLRYRDNEWRVDYGFPNKKDDLFYMTASLLEKEVVTKKDDFNNKEQFFYFNLEIIELSQKACFFMLKEIKHGDRIRLEISHYRREIDNCGYD